MKQVFLAFIKIILFVVGLKLTCFGIFIFIEKVTTETFSLTLTLSLLICSSSLIPFKEGQFEYGNMIT